MKLKTILITFIAATISTFSIAEQGPNKGPDHFKERKDHDVKMLNEKKAIIESALNCINGAQNPEALERCHKDEMEAHKKMQQNQLQERKKHLQEELKKVEAQEKGADHQYSP